MDTLPNLAGIATDDLVEKIGGSGFQASYINWSRTLNLLRTHAPGWHAELVTTDTGAVVHEAPVGAFLLIRFRHTDGTTTPPVPQAIMDARNAAIPLAKVTARDITDTHRRGVCMAAAFTFGLAYELWAKLPLESGYHGDEKPAKADKHEGTGVSADNKASPLDGVWDAIDPEQRAWLEKVAIATRDHMVPDDNGKITTAQGKAANDYLTEQRLENDERLAIWTLFNSTERAAMKRAHDQAQKAAA